MNPKELIDFQNTMIKVAAVLAPHWTPHEDGWDMTDEGVLLSWTEYKHGEDMQEYYTIAWDKFEADNIRLLEQAQAEKLLKTKIEQLGKHIRNMKITENSVLRLESEIQYAKINAENRLKQQLEEEQLKINKLEAEIKALGG